MDVAQSDRQVFLIRFAIMETVAEEGRKKISM
jgi:hypothetical protein